MATARKKTTGARGNETKAAKNSTHKPVSPASVEPCRREIDRIDLELIALLDERAGFARKIGEIKRAEGKVSFDAGRHLEKLNRIAKRGSGVFPIEGLRLVFGEIMSACLALQGPQQIAYLGPEATFSHIAAVRAFGRSIEYKPYGSIHDIFEAVEKNWVNFGIVPIENSTGGVIHTTLDELMVSPLSICAEIHIAVHHHLMARGTIEEIKRVCTHPQILSQCRNWLRAHLPNAIQIETSSSGEGAKMALKDKTIASIGPELASKIHGLPIVVSRIEDVKENITRFLIVGHQSPGPSGNDRTSIMFCIKDEPGALKELLSPFSDRGINLTKIESRPSRRRAWDYNFFVDMHGHMTDSNIIEALDAMRPYVTYLRVLGSYPVDNFITG